MSHSNAGQNASTTEGSALATVDPRAPRFGQTVTMAVLLVAIALQEPVLVLAIAIVLNTAVFSGWRLSLYGSVWRRALIPMVGKPAGKEPAAPHRFATLMGASMSAVATVLLFGAPAVNVPELALVGYGVALVHASAAAIGGVGDYCIGCRMYKQVAFFRRLGVV